MQAIPRPRFQSQRMYEAAKDAGLTQQDVAIRLGMSISAVQKWFLGTSTPAGDSLVALAQLMGRKPEWFFQTDADEVAA